MPIASKVPGLIGLPRDIKVLAHSDAKLVHGALDVLASVVLRGMALLVACFIHDPPTRVLEIKLKFNVWFQSQVTGSAQVQYQFACCMNGVCILEVSLATRACSAIVAVVLCTCCNWEAQKVFQTPISLEICPPHAIAAQQLTFEQLCQANHQTRPVDTELPNTFTFAIHMCLRSLIQ